LLSAGRDSLFGTDTRYHAYRARIDAAKKEDRERVQRESDAQALLDGEIAANEVLARADSGRGKASSFSRL
jgi:hypothetical protein